MTDVLLISKDLFFKIEKNVMDNLQSPIISHGAIGVSWLIFFSSKAMPDFRLTRLIYDLFNYNPWFQILGFEPPHWYILTYFNWKIFFTDNIMIIITIIIDIFSYLI